jgi:antirestriction protein ArdC
VFWKPVGGHDHGEGSTDELAPAHDERGGRRPRFFARGYCVFNEAQVDGRGREELPCLPESERIARADAFFAALNIPIVIGGNEAYYRPDTDTIFMPPFECFFDAASFYTVSGTRQHTAWGPSTGSTAISPAALARRSTPWTRSSAS